MDVEGGRDDIYLGGIFSCMLGGGGTDDIYLGGYSPGCWGDRS